VFDVSCRVRLSSFFVYLITELDNRFIVNCNESAFTAYILHSVVYRLAMQASRTVNPQISAGSQLDAGSRINAGGSDLLHE